MKREGRQHGMVQTYQIMPPPWSTKPSGRRRLINQFESPSTAGIFTKVPTKPTNHSKFTSRCLGRPRCNGCHDHPACKSKDKAKGTHKHKINNNGALSGLRLLSWRVVDSKPGLHYSGFSASGYLDHLEDDSRIYYDHLADENGLYPGGDPEIESGSNLVDDDDNLGFCDVGLVWEQVDDDVDDEGWCLVGEM